MKRPVSILAWWSGQWWVLHPLFFAAAFVLVTFASTPDPLWVLWRPLAVVLLIAITVEIVAILLVRNRLGGAYAAAAIIMAVALEWVVAVPLIVLPAWWVAINWLRRRRGRPGLGAFPIAPISRAIAVVSAVIVVLAAVNVAIAVRPMSLDSLPPINVHATAPPPNVYLLLLDGYPRDDALRIEAGMDNGPFLSALSDRGFAVAAHSRSNYTRTWLTLASMFNGAYAGSFGVTPATENWGRALTAAINGGRYLSSLHGLGYRIESSVSPFSDTALTSADTVQDIDVINEFETVLVQHTVLAAPVVAVAPTLPASILQQATLSSFDALRSFAKDGQATPIFALVHVMSPHPPFVFTSTGGPASPDPCLRGECPVWEPIADGRHTDLSTWATEEAAQISYLNELVLSAVDEVVARDPSAVVIIFGDHGTRYLGDADPISVETLFAARTPGRSHVFPDDVSLVNLLPHLLNAYFGASLPIQPYKAWAYIPTGGPLNLVPLTP